MVEWRDEVLAVLDAWVEAKGATGADGGSGTGRRPRRVGEARFDGEGGCYTVDLRGTPLAEVGLEGLAHLTLRGGAELPEYHVLRAHEANGLVHVRVGRHVTAPRLYLWAVRRPPAASLEAARRALGQLEQPGLAGRLARGEVDAPPEPPDGPASLDPGGQRQAFASCFAPGVFLVWGPPGTGKTEVLSQAVERLVEQGSRVLLVSPFGIAVDSALQRTLQRSGSPPGGLLRVGPPQLAELAAGHGVCLDERAPWACGSAETDRRELEAELLRMPERPGRARELEARLAGHDVAAYARASALVRGEEERTRLFVQELEVRDRLAAATRDERAEAERLAALRERWEDTVEHPLEGAEAERLQLATDEAASAWAAAAAAARSCDAELEQVTRRLEELSAGPRPTEAQRSLVHAAEAQDLPDLQEELEGVRRQIERDRERRPVLEAEHEERARELERRREDAEGSCVEEAQVVAATVDRALTDRHVAEGRYDVVLIDEAAAVPVPLLLPLVARAGRTAVLFGDFRRPVGAVEDERRLRGLGDAVVESWLDGVFARCGVRTPDDARDARVITLDCVDRLGADVLALANATSYDDQLFPAPGAPAGSPDEAEVVLFDTDGLGDVGSLRYQGSASGWWPVGSLLSVSLARQSRRAGETVGLLTPYGPQAAATAEMVRDVELGDGAPVPLADVATVPRAQGRSFDTVVLDLVEGSEREGWSRQGSWRRGRWERTAARLFTSGITRAGRRLALVGSGAAVRAAAEDSVLAPVRAFIEAGSVPVVPAASFLSRLDLPVVPVRDELELFEALRPHLERAERSVWMWAPWNLDRLVHAAPLLREARERGVRVAVFARAGAGSGDALEGAVRPVWVEDLRRKLIVVDGRVTMLGCAPGIERGDSADVLVVHTGPHFARHLLEQEHAELLSAPPRCARCGEDGVEVRRSAARGQGFPWAWGCPSPGCGWTKTINPRRDGRSSSTRAARKG